ncbi:endospore germination permease [Tumebacillus sp. ITR2]|uniref:Endospore germination permease n=1 Tax=Tumebacillus amylolyticus TaxID=2801339 RepID=A0ABS1J5Y0_9BACL|nr:endospore germination permease [Tumebacillus amylolyticus]MBL0385686.1 endospore germination permease [Tumebacillus amylolyticus]
MEKPSISTFHAVMLLVGSTGLLNHVLIIPMILQEVGRDAWISVLGTTGLALLWMPLLYVITKRTSQQHLMKWFQTSYGKWLANVLGVWVALYLLLVSVSTLKDMLTWTKVSYMTQTPTLALLVLFLALCFVNAMAGIQSVGAIGGILIPVVIVFGFFVMFGNMHQKNYHQLLPFLEHGWSPLLNGVLYAGAGFTELMYLVLMQHHVRKPIRFRTFLLVCLAFLGLTLGPLIGAIAEFGVFEAAGQRYPAYEEWRLLYIGRYVEHVDFLSIYQWLSGAFVRISLSMYLIPDVLRVKERKQRRWVMLGVSVCIGALVLWPISDMKFFDLLTRFGVPMLTLWLWVFSLVVGILVLVRRKQKGV